MTNADRIRAMTDEELLHLLDDAVANAITLPWCDYNKDISWCEMPSCDECIAVWLKQEVADEQ